MEDNTPKWRLVLGAAVIVLATALLIFDKIGGGDWSAVIVQALGGSAGVY